MDYKHFSRNLPEDLNEIIIKLYFKHHVLNVIKNFNPSYIWQKPSQHLSNLCNDPGCLQLGNNVENNLQSLFRDSADTVGSCPHCQIHCFPCINCATYRSNKIGVFEKWNIGNDKFKNIKLNKYNIKTYNTPTRVLIR